ncbi:MAG: hypothetical protein L0H29_08200, partial [Sinobacteraceae bacterium]|nr:hypothetical protein [Nevskiaceae bacterium]
MRALVELLNDWLEQLNPEDERLKEERRTLRGWRAICLDALKTRPPRHHRAAGHSVRSRRGGNQTRELDDPTPAYTALEEIRAASPEVLKEAGAPMIEAHGRRLMLLEPDEGTGTGLSKGQMF